MSYHGSWLTGLVLSLVLTPALAMSQATSNSDGPKFVRSSQKSDRFKSPRPPRPCHQLGIAGDIEFCHEGTPWTLEREVERDLPTLYRFDDARNAAITVVLMPEGASRKMMPAEAEELIEQYAFSKGPRGTRKLETVISKWLSPKGWPIRTTAIATEEDGKRSLLQLSLLKLDYGLAIVETMIRLSGHGVPTDLTDDQIAFHKDFLKAARVSHSIKVRLK